MTRRLLVACCGLLATTGALAITLGPHTRSAVLGEPLDISVQMMLEAGDDPRDLCLEASIFYADKQLDKSQMQVTAEKSATSAETLIRVRATPPVEGPVVTVHLRAGCVQKTTRRYVVLAAAKPRAGTAGGEPAAVQLVSPPALPASGASAEKIHSQEMEIRQLREELIKAQQTLADTRLQFEKAQADRLRKELVYGLVGILCFTFAGLLLLWRQRPSAPVSTGRDSTLESQTRLNSQSGVDLDVDESLFDELKRRPGPPSRPLPDAIPPLPRQDRARFSVSVPFVTRTVKVPELFDLQQQVEFFSSLGQYDRAIELLRTHLVNNVKTSALVYLDLLDLYRKTGNREAYEALRTDFNGVFNTHIAPFDDYTAVGPNIAAYQAVLARVQAAWPKRRVFEILDNTLFREPGNPAEVLDLEAYRELLLLHAVAREIIDLEADPGDSTFGAPNSEPQWPDLSMQPRSSPRLGVDIDLSEFAGSEQIVRTPEVRSRRGTAPPASQKSPSFDEPTVFDSLVDFDDYDTGFRPDDLDKKR
ncbi:MAG: hypothetical protein Q7T70_12800 [Polaromonas sp.]|nr:hypothetical protein [Polaromonas sp.]